MAKNNNLGDFLTDIANAIRTKKETSGIIQAQDFSDEILSIPSGGGSGIITTPDYYMEQFEDGIAVTVTKTGVLPNNFMALSVGNRITFSKLTIPNGVTSIGNSAFQYWSSNNQPLVIPDGVTSIGSSAFNSWSSNNQPLVIPNGVTSIGASAFSSWSSNNHPLVIPNSVTSIGQYAFSTWSSNNQPLVIPNSVTSISTSTFRYWTLVPYVEMKRTTPPTLANVNAFGDQNDAPIYVPDESVDAYKTATNWSDLASRIFPISSKP